MLAECDHEVESHQPAIPELAGRSAELASRLGLSRDEIDLLWTLIARAVDPELGSGFRRLFGNDARRGLALAHHALLAGIDPPRLYRLLSILSPDHPLRRRAIITSDDAAPDAWSPLRVPPRVFAHLAGRDDPDAGLAAIATHVAGPRDPILDDAQRAAIDRLRGILAASTPAIAVLEGPSGSGRRSAAALAAQRPLYAVDGLRLPLADVEAALAALGREVALAGVFPAVMNIDELVGRADGRTARLALARGLEAMDSVVVVTSAQRGIDLGIHGVPVLRVTWPLPDTATRRRIWVAVAGSQLEESSGELDAIAHRYRMGAGAVHAAVAAARHMSSDGATALTGDRLIEGIHNNIAEQLGDLATRVEVTQSWDELVLPAEVLDDVKALVGRVRHSNQVLETWGFRAKVPRGMGVAALFSGPPGTGKTMVAGLIAKELGLELYMADLSQVVSKWVGETEKQLAKIFAAAEAGHALLLFDEADSLFAKRTEVKSATDRYANLEVNYLLQRIESFGGVTILTTNLDSSIDPALRRRLAAHVVFEKPDIEESVRLWNRMLPPEVPVSDDLDFEALAAAFEAMAGANIRNAMLAAAFMAAEEGEPLSQGHLIRAARGEYRAMGYVLSSASRGRNLA
jgi:hypothetical protein